MAFSIEFTIGLPTGPDKTDGSVVTTITTDETVSVSFAWSNGATGPYLLNIGFGSYTLTVNVSNYITGEFRTETKTAVVALPLEISGQAYPVSTYGQTDGRITIFVSGGISPYSYAWTDGPTAQNRSGLAAGTYLVQATDAVGRQVEKSFSVLEGSQITDQPHLVATLPANGAFSHSPIILVAESEQVGAAGKAVLYASLPYQVAAGVQLAVNGVVFTAADQESENTFDRNNPAASFCRCINNTPSLNYKYVAQSGTVRQPYGIDFGILALKAGSRYNIDFRQFGLSVGVTNRHGTDQFRGDSMKNYGVLVEVRAGFTGNYNVPTTDNPGELPPIGVPLQCNYRLDNMYRFDLSALLRRLLPVWRPDPARVQLQHNPYSNFTFYCRLFEMYSTGASNYRQQVLKYETPLQKLLLGVLPQGTANSSKPWTYFAAGPALPLSVPLEKPVPYNGIELFSFVLDFANQAGLSIGQFNLLGLRLKVLLSLKDGTEQVRYTAAILPQQGGVYSQRVDPAALGITGQVADLEYYQVQAVIGATPITVPATYRPYESEYEVVRLMFLSTLGVFETFCFAGQTAQKVERQATTFTRTLPFEPALSDAYEQTLEVALRRLPTVYSHALSKEVYDWLIELLKSPEVYRLDDKLQPVPVTIADVASYEADSTTQLYSVAVTLRPHRTEHSLSR